MYTRSWNVKGKRRGVRFRRTRKRTLRVEMLENRQLLAITVNTLIDEADGSIVDGDISLRDALAAAPAGEAIDFDVSLDGGTILLTLGELPITRAMTLDATALPGGLTIDASGNDPTPDEDNGDGSRVFVVDDTNNTVHSPVTISGLTLTGGDVMRNGGAILSSESLTVTSSTISANAAGRDGGGISARGNLTVTSSTISGNSAGNRGGGISAGGNLTITSSAVSGNSAGNGGGGISAFDMTITSSAVSGNSAGLNGGGISANDVTVASSTISGNSAGTRGGGISAEYMTVTSSTISGNSAGTRGGGISAYYMTVTSSTVSGNSAREGGGISAGDVTVTTSTISRNSAGTRGGGIWAGDMTITSSTISGNSAGTYGGGISAYAVKVTSSTISGNSAREGGGIYARVNAAITSSTISGNSAREGGGIYARGNATITSSTISGNSVRRNGGGIWAGGNLTVTSSTISANEAHHNSGGIHADNDGIVTIENSIVAGNSDEGTAPDVRFDTGVLRVSYSLIGDNTGSGLIEAPVGMPDANGNLIGDPTGNGVIDPLLAPLANNGGPTETHALLFGSPALDAGDLMGLPSPFDQRGTPYVRFFGGRSDMGAYERQLVVDTLSDESDSDFSPGDLSLREAVQLANSVTLSNVITFDPSLNGGTILLTQGELPITQALSIDATALPTGVTIDASGNDPTPEENNGDGSRIFNIDDGNRASNSPVTISGLTLTGGDVQRSGGAIRSQESLTITSSTISGNSARSGGGVSAVGNLTVTSSTILGNSAGSGGGVLAYGDLTVTSSTISANSADREGGGIRAHGDLTVTSSTISGNSADREGGGIRFGNNYGFSRNVTIALSTISGNSSGQDGGGLSSWSNTGTNVTIESSTFSDNSADRDGGGIFNSSSGMGGGADLSIAHSTISHNWAQHNGGGVWTFGNLTVTSSTISGNTAEESGAGVDAYLGFYGPYRVMIANATITNNSASSDGGGIRSGGNVTVENSIVSGNTDDGLAPDIRTADEPLAVRYSLVGDNTGTGLAEAPAGMPDANGNLVGGPVNGIIDPLLAPLADNGGPTETHALLSGSPAIDMGDASFSPPPDFDQRGDPFARVFGSRIDMGAYERHTGDMNFDGTIDYDDIAALVLGLTDLDAYEVLYGAPPNANGDTDGDSDLDFDDISGFVELLGGGLLTGSSATVDSSGGDTHSHDADGALTAVDGWATIREASTDLILRGTQFRVASSFLRTDAAEGDLDATLPQVPWREWRSGEKQVPWRRSPRIVRSDGPAAMEKNLAIVWSKKRDWLERSDWDGS